MKWAKIHLIKEKTGVLIFLYIQPGASKTRVMGQYQDRIKISVQSQPVEGAANDAVMDFLRKLLQIPKSKIHLISGETSRLKSIWLENSSLQDVIPALETAMLKK